MRSSKKKIEPHTFEVCFKFFVLLMFILPIIYADYVFFVV